MNAIREALEKLASDGLLRPADVVEAARDINSPLHHHFCWDDHEAAQAWRESQARTLIRSIRIEIPTAGPAVEVRAYVSLPADRETGAGYRRMEDVMSSEFMKRQLFADIESHIALWQKKADALGYALDFSSIQSQMPGQPT